MNITETKLINILEDLKENYNATGVKAEFETENSSREEILKLKEFALKTGLDLTIKIGGCASIRDLCEAKEIGAVNIVAPMIESPYAFEKYINAVKTVFSETERISTDFLINIETVDGYKYIDEILRHDLGKYLSGIVVGRTDLINSLHISDNEINNNKIFEYASKLAEKTLKYGKIFIIGGGISAQSVPFLKQLPQNNLSKFETRKVIFNMPKALENENIDTGIRKALDFELMWIKNKQNYTGLSPADFSRIKALEARYNLSV